MNIRSIKNVDDETWKKFKILASQEGLSMASLLKNMVLGYGKKKSDVWGKVFEKAGNLSEDEAKKFYGTLNYLREEKGFRV